MPTDKTIDYLELPAADFDAVEAFYASTFGWSFTSYGEQYRAFSEARLEGGFYRSDLRSSSASGAALLVLYADDLEATQQRIVQHGGRICREIFAFPGGRRFHFLDPHGNELAVWSST